MTEVYIDVAAASIPPTHDDGVPTTNRTGLAGAAGWTADQGSVRALRYLTESGVRVVLVTADGVQPAAELLEVATSVLPAVPAGPRAPAWYLTSSIERCQGSSARLHTVLIGGTPPNGSIRRCDTVARDVQAAAMEILAADAMGGVRTHEVR